MSNGYGTTDEDNLYRIIDEMAVKAQKLCATLGDVKFFFREFKVADGDQGNPSLLLGNGADEARVAWAVANACSTVEKLNTLTNNAVQMVKSNASSCMKRKCEAQAEHRTKMRRTSPVHTDQTSTFQPRVAPNGMEKPTAAPRKLQL